MFSKINGRCSQTHFKRTSWRPYYDYLTTAIHLRRVIISLDLSILKLDPLLIP